MMNKLIWALCAVVLSASMFTGGIAAGRAMEAKKTDATAETGVPEPEADTAEQDNTYYVEQQNFLDATTCGEETEQWVRTLWNNMEVEAYWDEAVYMLYENSMLETIKSAIADGYAGIYLSDAETNRMLTVSLTGDENAVCLVHFRNCNAVTGLQYSEQEIKFFKTELFASSYCGAFEIWTVNDTQKMLIHEKGNILNEKLIKEYEIGITDAYENMELITLWGLRDEADYTTFTGNFGDDGISDVQLALEPDAYDTSSVTEGYVPYVYAENKAGAYVYCLLPEDMDTDGLVFPVSCLGLYGWTDITEYKEYHTAQASEEALPEPIEDQAENASETAETQIENTSETTEAQTESASEAMENPAADSAEQLKQYFKDRFYVLNKIVVETPAPVTTPKPSSPTPPAATPAPAVTTPAPDPTPAEPPQNEDNDDGGGSSDDSGNDGGGSDNGSSDDNSGDSGSSGGDSGSDADIEWSDDML